MTKGFDYEAIYTACANCLGGGSVCAIQQSILCFKHSEIIYTVRGQGLYMLDGSSASVTSARCIGSSLVYFHINWNELYKKRVIFLIICLFN